jgi:hypothetical protein
MKVICVSLGSREASDPWLTLNGEYRVLSILMTPRGPAKLRVLANDQRTPILADATMFAGYPQSLPSTWGVTIREGGVVEIGPPAWLEIGFWDRYFDGDIEAVAQFRNETQDMTRKSGQ